MLLGVVKNRVRLRLRSKHNKKNVHIYFPDYLIWSNRPLLLSQFEINLKMFFILKYRVQFYNLIFIILYTIKLKIFSKWKMLVSDCQIRVYLHFNQIFLEQTIVNYCVVFMRRYFGALGSTCCLYQPAVRGFRRCPCLGNVPPTIGSYLRRWLGSASGLFPHLKFKRSHDTNGAVSLC